MSWLYVVLGIFFGLPIAICLGYTLFLFVSVVFLGESSACPQNLC